MVDLPSPSNCTLCPVMPTSWGAHTQHCQGPGLRSADQAQAAPGRHEVHLQFQTACPLWTAKARAGPAPRRRSRTRTAASRLLPFSAYPHVQGLGGAGAVRTGWRGTAHPGWPSHAWPLRAESVCPSQARPELGQEEPHLWGGQQRHRPPESGQVSVGSPLARPTARPGKEGISYHLLCNKAAQN